MTSQSPDYHVSKPSGSTLLIESRTPSSDVGGVIVTPGVSATNHDDIDEIEDSGVGASSSHLSDSNDSGPGLRSQASGQVTEELGDDDDGGRSSVEGEHDIRPHAGHYPRVRKRLSEWKFVCGGPLGRCKRPRCVRDNNSDN